MDDATQPPTELDLAGRELGEFHVLRRLGAGGMGQVYLAEQRSLKREVKVADFGLSRCFLPDAQPLSLTQTGVTMGTPLYMSPEQVQGQPVDARSDIYSFGVTCYALLTGHPPFRGQTVFELALKHV